MFSLSLSPSLPVDWGPTVGERGALRRRERLLFPHNNRGIHGHPAPHQSTERGGGMEELKDGKDGGRGGLAGGRQVHESRMNGEEEFMKRGRVDIHGEVRRGYRGRRGINKDKEEKK